MTPIELYWPPEILAQAYPAEFGHLLQTIRERASPPSEPIFYTTEHLAGGCILYRLTDRPYLHGPTFGQGVGLGEREAGNTDEP